MAWRSSSILFDFQIQPGVFLLFVFCSSGHFGRCGWKDDQSSISSIFQVLHLGLLVFIIQLSPRIIVWISFTVNNWTTARETNFLTLSILVLLKMGGEVVAVFAWCFPWPGSVSENYCEKASLSPYLVAGWSGNLAERWRKLFSRCLCSVVCFSTMKHSATTNDLSATGVPSTECVNGVFLYPLECGQADASK